MSSQGTGILEWNSINKNIFIIQLRLLVIKNFVHSNDSNKSKNPKFFYTQNIHISSSIDATCKSFCWIWLVVYTQLNFMLNIFIVTTLKCFGLNLTCGLSQGENYVHSFHYMQDPPWSDKGSCPLPKKIKRVVTCCMQG